MSEPERLADLLPRVVRELAVFCAVADLATGDLCRAVGPHEQHNPDGDDASVPTTTESGRTA